MNKSITIHRVNSGHLELLTPLFNAYRIFYAQQSSPAASKAFLKERIDLKESVIFLALINGQAAGFTQLYPTFSSVTLQRFYILNDLFTSPEFRGYGAGKALLDAAKELVIDQGMKGLALETDLTNPAQKLYEREGWEKNEEYLHYFWKNT